MTDEFEVIEPLAASVVFIGKERQIVPLKVGQLPKFARAMKNVGAVDVDGLLAGDVDAFISLLADHGEAIIEAVAIASGIDRAEIEGSTADEMIRLATAVLKVNADFFARRLTPAIKAAAAQANGAGLTPSMP